MHLESTSVLELILLVFPSFSVIALFGFQFLALQFCLVFGPFDEGKTAFICKRTAIPEDISTISPAVGREPLRAPRNRGLSVRTSSNKPHIFAYLRVLPLNHETSQVAHHFKMILLFFLRTYPGLMMFPASLSPSRPSPSSLRNPGSIIWKLLNILQP